MTTAYCPTCRAYFEVDSNPPYGVIHKAAIFEKHPDAGKTVEVRPVTHLHAVTRQPLTPTAPLTAAKTRTEATASA